MPRDPQERERIALEAEEQIRERRDLRGRLWHKVYVGGGKHLENWLAQARELVGEERVELEPIEPQGLACFEGSGEQLTRIWVLSDRDETNERS